ncbi:MAG: tetratricopeptide repeat protein, partial [Trueperaceae bacterium]
MRLRTLGGLELEGPPMRRPKPLLLLAYLALEGRQPRRRLSNLFWPDSADGRNRLSVTLKRLRSEAPGTVDADATSVATTLACDVHELHDALASEDVDRVLRLHHGAFLAGVDLKVGIEVEEWLYDTRERLADRAREVLLRRAERLARDGEFERAAALAERANEVAGATEPKPDDASRLIDLLCAGSYDRRDPALRLQRSLEEPSGPIPERTEAQARLSHARSDAPTTHALPTATTSFVGRERERAGIADLFDRVDARLVTILGPGGVGKSRLALEVAREQARSHRLDALVLVPLDGVRDGPGIETAIAAAVGPPSGYGAPTDTALEAALRDARVLLVLVLDEAEGAAHDAVVLSDLLARFPTLRQLVTSRQRLELEAEHVWQLGGLSLETPTPADGAPGRASGSPVTDRSDPDAVRLFWQRAQRARADLARRDQDAPHVRHICETVDGSPLAIELAAVWVRSMPVVEIAGALDASIDALATPSRDIASGHVAMRAVFDRSWSLLAEHERTVLLRASVFDDGFDDAAARQVAGANARTLRALVDASMLVASDAPVGGRRHRLPTLLRRYVRERLEDRPDLAARAETRHVQVMERLALRAGPRLLGADQASWLDRLALDAANLRASLVHAARRAPRAGLRIAASLRTFWTVHGHGPEVAGALMRLLAHPAAAEPTVDRARGLSTLAHLAPWSPHGATAAQEALWIAAMHEDAAITAHLELLCAFVLLDLGRPAEAEQGFLQVLRRPTDQLPASVDASARNGLGIVASGRDDHDRARRWYASSLQIASRLDDAWSVASRQYNLGIVAKRSGALGEARTRYRTALATNVRLGDRLSAAYTIEGLACLASASGDPRHAATLWGAVDAER